MANDGPVGGPLLVKLVALAHGADQRVGQATLGGEPGQEPETLEAQAVTADFFSVLGVQPIYGRLFLPEEDKAGRNQEIILSYKLWQSSFGGDRKVIG